MKKIAFVTVLFCMFLISCEKEKIENQISIKNEPYLEFSDFNAFVASIGTEMTTKSAQTSGQFQSFNDVYYEFLDKINDTTITYQEYKALLDKYQDVIVIEDDMITAKIENPLVGHIVNRYGIVKIGEALVKYTNTEKITSLNGDFDLLIKAESTHNSIDGIERFSYHNIEVKSSGIICGWNHETEWVLNKDKNRIGKLKTYIKDERHYYGLNQSGEILYDFVSYSITQGFAKMKNVFGNWVDVKTKHTLDLTFICTTGSNHYTHITNQITQNSSDAYTISKWNLLRTGRGTLNQAGSYQSVYTQINKNRYTNRGFDTSNPRWIEIECSWY